MIKNLVINVIFLLCLLTFIIMSLSSCNGFSHHERSSLSSNEHSTFYITYSKNDIAVRSSKDTRTDHFFYNHGEYYTSDSTLFFSVVRDTAFNITDDYGHKHKIEIEKMKNGQYMTSSYLINEGGIYFYYCPVNF